MKKLSAACAVCLLAGFVSAQSVVSQNIVGYQTKTTTNKFYSAGATFISVGSTNVWKLSDVTATGMDPFADIIQFLSTSTAATVLQATYIDAAFDLANGAGDGALVGWWDPNDLGGTSRNAQVLAAGTGFLCNFSSPSVSLTYAGQVLQGSTTLNLSGKKFPLVTNFTPVDLTLGQISATGMDPFADIVQFLSPTTAATILQATYIDAAFDVANGAGDGALVGWWDPNDLGVTSRNSQALPAGSAILGNFSSPSVQLTFPSAIN